MKMNGHVAMEPAAALLFVRSHSDLGMALEQVNGLLALRRHRRCTQSGDKVLAVWFRRDLDCKLPLWSLAVDSLGATTQVTGNPDVSLAIQESFSLAGIWTLCWIGSPALRSARESAQQRELVLRNLTSGLLAADSGGSFCPVFDQGQSPESVAAEMMRLKDGYPVVMGLIRFCQDSNRGVYCEEDVVLENHVFSDLPLPLP